MRELRISIVLIVTMLICIGVVMIYSSSGVYALKQLGSKTYFLHRHLIFLTLGLLLSCAVMAFDYREFQSLAKPLLLLGVFLLILVLLPIFGHSSFGARRWFKLGTISFQPTEYVKLAILVYTADFLARKEDRIGSFWNGFLPVMLVMGFICALIVKQPDLGSSILIAAIVLIMIFIGGAKLKHLAVLIGLSAPLLIYLIVSEPYRMRRIMAFIDPWQDSQGVGFRLSQSPILHAPWL